MRTICTLSCQLLMWCVGVSLASGAPPVEKVDFNRQIRPLLSDRCFQCHGPDEKQREAELRLDTREGAMDADALIPGDPDRSELLRRILSTDPEEHMPPLSAKKRPFTPDEIQLLSRWIAEGAEFAGHWAFLPIQRTPPPQSLLTSRNAIDDFIAARLQAVGLEPSPEAPREILIRRVSLDLLGLLPTPEEVAAFVENPAPNAYEQLVDRLLASPHYGERWGRHWLDQARYADSNGYSIDGPREMWPYRDWTIEAFNRDLPFDQFTIEQLAGDLLPNADKSQLLATGFHRNTLINQEGGTDPEQFRTEAAMDRANTTGAVWLGLTVGCAQCHTHKYDPLTQREYYEFMGFFNSGQDVNSVGATVEVVRGEVFGQPVTVEREPPAPSAQQLAEWRKAWEDSSLARLKDQQTSIPEGDSKWTSLPIESVTSTENSKFQQLDDQSWLAVSPVATFDSYRIVARSPIPSLAAIRLRVLPHESLPKGGPGRAGNGNFVLTGFELHLGDEPVGWKQAIADLEQVNYPIAATLDDDTKTGWAINVASGSTVKMNAPHEAIFVLQQPIAADGQPLELNLRHELNPNYQIGRFAIDVIAETPHLMSTADVELLAALGVPEAERTAEQKQLLQQAFEQAEPRARKIKPKANPDLAKLMVMRDLPKPRETYLLTRGDFTRPNREAGVLHPGVFAAIWPPLVSDPATRTRLDLARWLVDPEHPLTSRVTTNRLWMRYFGRGLVETEEDFGTQGSPPTHPELLDWLSAEFQRQNWSLKAMHRLIVTSATYRQSSVYREDLAEKDPRNLLLGRQERLRVDAEIIRDLALSASGRLQDVLGGPSVYPPQPDGVYAFTQVNKSWPTETGRDRYRRTLYTFFYRSAPYPLFTTFDSPDFQSVCTRRIRSNTPLQALTLANDVVFVELAQGLAERVVQDRPGDFDAQLGERIERMFQLALCRPPQSREHEQLRSFAKASLESLTADADSAGKLVTPQLAAGVTAAEAATLVLVARVIFNTDNFITRE